jgi:hypothetical protein
MCVNCLSQSEAVVAQSALVAMLVREPIHHLLAELGVVDAPSYVARDAHTVSFLRSLDLDADAVLGAPAVAAADSWVAAGRPRKTRARAWASARRLDDLALARITTP